MKRGIYEVAILKTVLMILLPLKPATYKSCCSIRKIFQLDVSLRRIYFKRFFRQLTLQEKFTFILIVNEIIFFFPWGAFKSQSCPQVFLPTGGSQYQADFCLDVVFYSSSHFPYSGNLVAASMLHI